MASAVFSTVWYCQSCILLRGTLLKHRKLMNLLLATGPFEFVAMIPLGPLKKTARGNTFILIRTVWFSERTICVPFGNSTACTVAPAFSKFWVYEYGAVLYVLTDNQKPFFAKFFHSLWRILGSKHYRTTV